MNEIVSESFSLWEKDGAKRRMRVNILLQL